MKDDHTLVIGVYEGRGIPPKGGLNVMVTAQLDGNQQLSDPIPLTSHPKFNMEFTWTLPTATLRRFKQNRTPLKLECLAVDAGNITCQNFGYIVLHLHTAVQGHVTDLQWYRLLGGVSGPHKVPPALQLTLNILPSTPAVKEEMRDVEDGMEIDPLPDPQFLCAINNLTSGQEVTVVSAGRRVGIGSGKHLGQAREENDLVIVDGTRSREHTRRSSQRAPGGNEVLKLSDDEIREVEEVREVRLGGRSGHNLRSRTRTVIATTPQTPRTRTHSPATSSPRTQRSTNHLPEVDIVPRHLSDSLMRSYSQRNPRNTGPATVIRENGHPGGQHHLRSVKSNNIDLPVALPGPSTPRPGPSTQSNSDPTLVVPRLSADGGFFQLGPAGEPNEQTFNFSVTIVYAKHLDQVVPSEVKVNEEQQARFCYSLLGHVVFTDPIKDLSNPDFLAERAGGKVMATASNVSQYFIQHPQLPIHLLLGDVCLATANVDLAEFGKDVLRGESPMMVEGQHPLLAVMGDPLARRPTQQPILGVTVILSVTPKEEPQQYHSLALRESVAPTSSLILVDHSSSTSHSSASDSEEDWMHGSEGRRSHKKSVARASRKLTEAATSWKHKRKGLMYEAAMEMETWKEGQQQVFWQQWSAREQELQRHLSKEWEARVSETEMHLHRRLDQCQTLHRRLTDGLVHLDQMKCSVSIKEGKLLADEEDVAQMKADVKAQKKKLRKSSEMGKREREAMEIGMLKQQLLEERQKRRRFQDQVRVLEAANEASDRTTHVTHLGNQLKDEEIEALKTEKDQLNEQLSEALERKQHYKARWIKVTAQLHKQLSNPRYHHNQPHEQIRLEMGGRSASPPPLYVQTLPTTSTTKSLKYREENHMENEDRGHPTRRLRCQKTEVQVKIEPEVQVKIEPEDKDDYREPEIRWRKDNKPGKSTELNLSDLIKERKELSRLVRKRGSLDDDLASLYPPAIQEAQKKIRSLDDR